MIGTDESPLPYETAVDAVVHAASDFMVATNPFGDHRGTEGELEAREGLRKALEEYVTAKNEPVPISDAAATAHIREQYGYGADAHRRPIPRDTRCTVRIDGQWAVFDRPPFPGTIWIHPITGDVWHLSEGGGWVDTSLAPADASTSAPPNDGIFRGPAPANPKAGMLWQPAVGHPLHVYNGLQWVANHSAPPDEPKKREESELFSISGAGEYWHGVALEMGLIIDAPNPYLRSLIERIVCATINKVAHLADKRAALTGNEIRDSFLKPRGGAA